MLLLKLKPNWRYIHQFKKRPFIHFNNQTFGNGNSFTQEFKDSFHHLPPDKYIPNNNPVTVNVTLRKRSVTNKTKDFTRSNTLSVVRTSGVSVVAFADIIDSTITNIVIKGSVRYTDGQNSLTFMYLTTSGGSTAGTGGSGLAVYQGEWYNRAASATVNGDVRNGDF